MVAVILSFETGMLSVLNKINDLNNYNEVGWRQLVHFSQSGKNGQQA